MDRRLVITKNTNKVTQCIAKYNCDWHFSDGDQTIVYPSCAAKDEAHLERIIAEFRKINPEIEILDQT